MKKQLLLAAILAATAGLSGFADAQMIEQGARINRVRPVRAAGSINLPYSVPDKSGNQWMIYPGGWFRQNGNMPVYSQASQLIIDGNNPNVNNNQGRMDPATGELVLENMPANNVTVTRRLRVDPDDGSLRVIDIFTPQQGADSINVTLQTSLNFGVQAAQNVMDPKDNTREIAWAAMTGGNRAAMVWFGGLGKAPCPPDINWQQGNNVVTASFNLPVSGGKPVAIVSVYQTTANQQMAADLASKIDPKKLLADVPKDLRKLIVNVRPSHSIADGMEILRGDALDVVELRNGDRVTGTLADTSFKLAAPYGDLDVPVERVLGVINVGAFKPRQLIITMDGQIFGGTLAKETIDVAMPGGQTTSVPLRQISRVGMRKRVSEPEEVTLDQPYVVMAQGDRIAIAPPEAPLALATRFGTIQLPATAIASVQFQDEDSAVHIVKLNDGTTLSGLIVTPELAVTLADGKHASLPTAQFVSMRLATGDLPEVNDDDTPILRTLGDDTLVGSLTGDLELSTTFDTLKLPASGIRGLTRAKGMSADVQITTWDGATLSGQLGNDILHMRLASGVAIDVPVGLVVSYSQPRPQPSDAMLEQIKKVVADLNAADWKQRDLAESQLVAMGPSVANTLKQLRGSQPAEVQQRIDSVLKQVEKK